MAGTKLPRGAENMEVASKPEEEGETLKIVVLLLNWHGCIHLVRSESMRKLSVSSSLQKPAEEGKWLHTVRPYQVNFLFLGFGGSVFGWLEKKIKNF